MLRNHLRWIYTYRNYIIMLFLLATSIVSRHVTPSDRAHVSPFYGPGTYLAWLFTMLSATINTIASTTVWDNSPQRSSGIYYGGRLAYKGIDLEFIFAIGYPIFAISDFHSRRYGIGFNVDDASLQAALFVSRSALVLAYGGQFVCNYNLVPPLRKYVLSLLCLLSIGTEPLTFWTPAFNWLILTFVLLGAAYDQAVKMAFTMSVTSPDPPTFLSKMPGFALTILIHVLNVKLLPPYSIVPITDAQFSDWDQATGLCLALVSIFWGWSSSVGVKMLRKAFKRGVRRARSIILAPIKYVYGAFAKLIGYFRSWFRASVRRDDSDDSDDGQELEPMAHGALPPATEILPMQRAVTRPTRLRPTRRAAVQHPELQQAVTSSYRGEGSHAEQEVISTII